MNEEEKEVIKNIKLELEMTGDMPRLVFSRNDIECMLKLLEKQQEAIEYVQNEYIQNQTICGRSFDEIVNILTALDIEKQYKIEVTMENLKSLVGIYQAEVEKSIQNAQIKIIDDLTGKGCKIEYTLPHYNFDEENKDE